MKLKPIPETNLPKSVGLKTETKPAEDMETKEEKSENPINLYELLQGHEGETFYSPCYGVVTLEKVDKELLSLTVRAKSNNKLHTLGYNGAHPSGHECMLYPSNEHRRAYTPEGAWKEWQDGQKKIILQICYAPLIPDDILLQTQQTELVNLNFLTPADRDKCIEEVKAIIEKYSK